MEDLLAERGVIASRETDCQFVRRFGCHFAEYIRRDRPRAKCKWRLNAVRAAHDMYECQLVGQPLCNLHLTVCVFVACSVRVAPAAFAVLQPHAGCRSLPCIIEGLDLDLTLRSDPTPVSNHRQPAKQCGLKRNHIEAPHVSGGINATEMDVCGLVIGHD